MARRTARRDRLGVRHTKTNGSADKLELMRPK
jgi:hypothetical protein